MDIELMRQINKAVLGLIVQEQELQEAAPKVGDKVKKEVFSKVKKAIYGTAKADLLSDDELKKKAVRGPEKAILSQLISEYGKLRSYFRSYKSLEKFPEIKINIKPSDLSSHDSIAGTIPLEINFFYSSRNEKGFLSPSFSGGKLSGSVQLGVGIKGFIKIIDEINEQEPGQKMLKDLKKAVSNLQGEWKDIENTLNHELVHLIQHTTQKGIGMGRSIDKDVDLINKDIDKFEKQLKTKTGLDLATFSYLISPDEYKTWVLNSASELERKLRVSISNRVGQILSHQDKKDLLKANFKILTQEPFYMAVSMLSKKREKKLRADIIRQMKQNRFLKRFF